MFLEATLYGRIPLTGFISFLRNNRSLIALVCSRHHSSKSVYVRSVINQSSIVKNLPILDLSYTSRRFKYKKTKAYDSDEESDDSDIDENNAKLVTGYVTSLRVDGVLKAGLGLARNKVEANFYDSRIRVNGKKIFKKSHKVGIGDEVDVIKGENMMNDSLLDISRVIVVSAKETDDGDKLVIKMKRFKSLTVEEYEEPWKKEHKE